MRHPILSNSGYKYYIPIWSLIALVHTAVLFNYFEFSIEIALGESLLYNITFASLAPGLWYIVSFAGLNKDELSVIGTHLVAAMILVFAWAGLSGYILGLIFSEEELYLNFLSQSYLWRLIIGTIYYSIVILVYYLIKNYKEARIREHKEVELQSLLKDSELRMLKAQINPHFIFNSLNSISALTISKPEKAREMVIKLSDFLRYSLGKDSIQMNSLDKEVQNLMLYLDMEKVRFGNKLSIEKEISEISLSVLVPNLILQPLVENAIKYGVYESEEKVTIHIKCEVFDEMLHITIENEFDQDAIPSKGEGIGLSNVEKRLALVYNRSDLLKIENRGNVFVVRLKIPLDSNNG